MLRFAAIASVLLVAGPAQAVSVTTFDFTSAGPNQTVGQSETFTEGGLSVEATALWQFGGAYVPIPGVQVVQGPNGLGVTNPNDDAWNGSDGQIDNLGINEGLVLDFSREVRVDEIAFGSAGRNDQGTIFVDFAGDNTDDFFQQEASLNLRANNPYTAMFNGLVDRILFGVPGGFNFNDDYYLSSITVTQMPVPAAGVLFGSALGLAGLWRRRAAKAAQA
ncbi:MAG: hypothetical protein AAF221_01140 [Pseudomonadota bacterium]